MNRLRHPKCPIHKATVNETCCLQHTLTLTHTHTHTADEQLNEDTIKSNGEKQKVCGK